MKRYAGMNVADRRLEVKPLFEAAIDAVAPEVKVPMHRPQRKNKQRIQDPLPRGNKPHVVRVAAVDRYIETLKTHNIPLGEVLTGKFLTIAQLYSQGVSLEDVAAHMNMGRGYIWTLLYAKDNSVYTKLRYWIPRITSK